MDSVLFILVCIIILGLTFDFINGFHDTANTIATSVSTRALPPQVAIVMAALMNFFGALLFTGVAQTITKDIVDPFSLENGSIVLLCALIGAIAWNLITWYYGIPSSSSHALVGSIAGATIVSEGLWSLNYSGFIRILEALLISPVAALIIGFLVMSLFKVVFRNSNLAKTNKGFRILQIMTAALQSFSHGTNDAQKTMGIMTMALITAGFQTTTDIPTWIRVSVALAMGLGTMVGGWRIIKTVGGKITKLKPVSGAAADLSSAFIIFGFTFLHLPVSTTHVISSSIMGVGSAQRVKDVKWGVARRIVFTWIITMPITALLSACLYKVVMLFV
ncbi:anion permease [Brevibacillus laterosporus]|uniref:inorganic phosphate transporter n=1 Tax=Brevibacillus laterosporus TaxID=1465 RepID=UPI000C77933A|nr:inorganic phosphate transporter [Brevibacillus laterosporus]AUM65312.1 anion permease [Brevibacillus laterosporus]